MSTIAFDGTRLNVVERGTGEVLLLVHGFPLNHRMWQRQIEAFSDEFRVLAPDLRGFGESGVAEGTITMQQFADDLRALLDALAIAEPIHYCGLSMGGYVAWPFVRKYAGRLKSLILCDTRAGADSPEGVANRHKLAENVLKHGSAFAAQAMLPKLFADATVTQQPHVVQSVERMILEADPRCIAAALLGMAERPDSTGLLPSIQVPVLAIAGEHDILTPPDEMRGLTQSIPQAQFAEVENAGHMAPMEQPDAVNAAIRRFLHGLRTA